VLSAGLHFDLQALLTVDGPEAQDETVKVARRRCFQTLSSFMDPFNKLPDVKNEFHFSIDLWHGGDQTTLLSDQRDLDYSNFYVLEHAVDGKARSNKCCRSGKYRIRTKLLSDSLA
jgi:hypothetical protein